jgi:hypothetical protein
VSNGYKVAADQLRAHARNVETVKDRFGAVKAASAHITQNDAAYGMLCRWMPAVLEGRHKTQDQLYAYVEENLNLVAQRLRRDAQRYDDAERFATDSVNSLPIEPGWTQ